MGPVDHAAGDELRIGHQDFDVVIGGNAGGADIDIADLAGDAGFELDEIADFQRTVEQKNQAGNEIAEDRLQAKTQTDTDGANESPTEDDREIGSASDRERGV